MLLMEMKHKKDKKKTIEFGDKEGDRKLPKMEKMEIKLSYRNDSCDIAL